MDKLQLRDYVDLNFDYSTLTKTKDGYLTGKICVTGAGVFRYRDSSGSGIIPRLRPRDEVMRSLASLSHKPVTYNHPDEFVTPENSKELTVGLSDSDVEWDGLNAFVSVTITDAEAIAAIERGELKAISCGYECVIENDEGVWQGTPYTQVQKNITYNHIALVNEGRAGDSVKFKLGDSADIDFKQQTGENAMTKHIIDGVECQGDEAFMNAYQKQTAALADAMKELETVKAARDAAEASVKALSEKNSDEAIYKAVADKLELLAKAKELGVEADVKMDDSAIKDSVIKKAFKDLSTEGKSKDYIDGLFDSACKFLKSSPANDQSLESHEVQSDEADPEKAYKAMVDKMFKNNKEA